MKDSIVFERINSDNLELACKIQNEIFPKENGKQNYIEQINNDLYRREIDYYIVFNNNAAIGVTGLYSYHEYPKTAWLGWFGILKKYRNNGFGGQVLDKTIELAKSKGYKFFRLYTDEYAIDAHRLYISRGLEREIYDNPLDKDNFIDAEIFIYSKSLSDCPLQKWNNKLLGLKEQSNKEHNL